MDDLEKQASSYQQDQEILDARGINMTVEEVAGLTTVKYSEKVQALQLKEEDLSFLKGLRRRIKNRLASQNSRRRSLEHLRRLTRELRVVRARRDDALAERRALLRRRDAARDACRALRQHVKQILQERSDPSQIPDFDELESQLPKEIKKSRSPDLSESYRDKTETYRDKIETYRDKTETYRDKTETYRDKNETYRDKNETFECRIEKLVQKSVNHIFEKKKVSAKTVFLDATDKYFDKKDNVFIKKEETPVYIKEENDYMKEDNAFIKEELDVGCKVLREENGGVLDLCVKEKRKSHGRKQSAPRRIAYVADYDDMVLDLKIKKENQ